MQALRRLLAEQHGAHLTRRDYVRLTVGDPHYPGATTFDRYGGFAAIRSEAERGGRAT